MALPYMTNVVYEADGNNRSKRGFERLKKALLNAGENGSINDVVEILGIKWHRGDNFVGSFENYEGFEVKEDKIFIYSDSRGVPDMAVYAIIARCLDLRHFVISGNNYGGLLINTDVDGEVFNYRYIITNIDSEDSYDYAIELKYYYDSKAFASLDSIFRFFKEELGITVPLEIRVSSFAEQRDYFKGLNFILEKFEDYYFQTEKSIEIGKIASRYRKENK